MRKCAYHLCTPGAGFDLKRAAECLEAVELNLTLFLLQQAVPATEEGLGGALIRDPIPTGWSTGSRSAEDVGVDRPYRIEKAAREDRRMFLVEERQC